MTDEELQAEIKRLATPARAPSFWRYLLDKNVWVYYNVPTGLVAWLFAVFYFHTWWVSLLVGVFYGAILGNAVGSWRLWRQRVRWQRKDEEWVTRMSSGPHPFPGELAWTLLHLINEDKTHVAARVALDYLTATDPECRRWVEEFDALSPEEQERRRREALAFADEDIKKGGAS